MRVLVLHWGRNGGGPRFAADAVAGFREAGLQTLFSYSAQSERAPLDHDAAHVGLPVSTFMNGRQAVLRAPRAIVNARRLRRYAIDHKVDCVFAAMEQIWQPAVARAFRDTPVPYLLGVHDADFHPGDRSRVQAATRALEVRASDGLLTFSSSVSEAVEQRWNYPFDRVWRTFLPVRVAVSAGGRGDGTLRVGFFGRWLPYKGIPLLVDAARILHGRGVDCVVEIHGDGIEPALERDDLPSNLVVRRGWTSEEDVEAVLGRFDVLVAPYSEASQSGVVPLAAALGIPSVVTPVGGLTEQVEDRKTGLIAARADAASIASALAELVGDRSMLAALGAAAEQDIASRRSAAAFGRAAAEAMADLVSMGKRDDAR